MAGHPFCRPQQINHEANEGQSGVRHRFAQMNADEGREKKSSGNVVFGPLWPVACGLWPSYAGGGADGTADKAILRMVSSITSSLARLATSSMERAPGITISVRSAR